MRLAEISILRKVISLFCAIPYARLRAFPPQAVLGPCFSTGWRWSFMFRVVTPVYGRPAGRAKQEARERA